jgi:hypothetical protein
MESLRGVGEGKFLCLTFRSRVPASPGIPDLADRVALAEEFNPRADQDG